MPRKYDFNAYLVEARPAPFVLSLAHDDEIVIEPPDAETALKLDEARTARRVLELLCGEHYTRIHGLLKDKPYTAMNAFADDLRRHFHLDLDVSEGGSRASST